jgi:hypothetical protein
MVFRMNGILQAPFQWFGGKSRVAPLVWDRFGAASLFQLALDGPGNPAGCKFPATMSKIQLTDIIEIIDVTETAARKID